MSKLQMNIDGVIKNIKKLQVNKDGGIINLKKLQANIDGIIQTIWTGQLYNAVKTFSYNIPNYNTKGVCYNKVSNNVFITRLWYVDERNQSTGALSNENSTKTKADWCAGQDINGNMYWSGDSSNYKYFVCVTNSYGAETSKLLHSYYYADCNWPSFDTNTGSLVTVVTYQTYSGSPYYVTMHKYNSSLIRQWEVPLASSVTGAWQGAMSKDGQYFIAESGVTKLRRILDGNVVWVNNSYSGQFFEILSDGSVIVSAVDIGTPTHKLSSSGAYISTISGMGNYNSTHVTRDESDNLYMCAGSQSICRKYDKDLNLIWQISGMSLQGGYSLNENTGELYIADYNYFTKITQS